MAEEFFSNDLTPEESSAEQALRPNDLSEFIGQGRVRDQVSLLLRAASERKSDRKSTRLNSSHVSESRMPSSA